MVAAAFSSRQALLRGSYALLMMCAVLIFPFFFQFLFPRQRFLPLGLGLATATELHSTLRRIRVVDWIAGFLPFFFPWDVTTFAFLYTFSFPVLQLSVFFFSPITHLYTLHVRLYIYIQK